jgi:diguanylate cyclase (GGDEF)-like protein/PAS domain S-box-containing protein
MGKDARPGPKNAVRSRAAPGVHDRARLTLDAIGDAVVSVDLARNVTYLNAVAADMTGWTTAEASGRPLAEVLRIIDAETREPTASSLERAMVENRSVGLSPNSVLLRRDGFEFAIEDTSSPIHDADGAVIGAVIVFHDVGVARERSARMAHLAYHDALTGLPNRSLLSDRISQAIGSARRHRKSLAVLFDRFKSLNDRLGHPAGDEMLRTIGRNLTACVRSSDTVSRFGGDEFVVLLTDLDCAGDAATTVRKMLAAIAEPQRIGEHELEASVSVGIAMFPAHGGDAATLLRNADQALLGVKANGRCGYRFFEPENSPAEGSPAPRHPPLRRNASVPWDRRGQD